MKNRQNIYVLPFFSSSFCQVRVQHAYVVSVSRIRFSYKKERRVTALLLLELSIPNLYYTLKIEVL